MLLQAEQHRLHGRYIRARRALRRITEIPSIETSPLLAIPQEIHRINMINVLLIW
jgi:hypothetical protein